ncbi:MAG: MarC family protein [Candidatus ainarchaeum sp.]|nr:MarC family protein [Candidatus ainarchaeum sp.]
MADFVSAFIPAFFYILFIVDPLVSIPMFISLTKRRSTREMHAAASKAVLIAGVIAVLFLFLGPPLLGVLHVSLGDFKIAGGIVLSLLGLEAILGIRLQKAEKSEKDSLMTVAVLIATPMLTGPGLMSALIVLSDEQGATVTLAATIAALAASWVVLYNAPLIRKLLGNQVIAIGSKVVGVPILALGISYARAGIIA